MESKATLLGHPIHQMLVAFPLGLLGASVVFDLLAIALGQPTLALVAYYVLAGGVLAGLVAAPFGFIDWRAIPHGTRARRVGAMHGGGNVLMLSLFALSWWLRWEDAVWPPREAVLLSLLGAGISVFTAWLGGELVDRLGIGVADGAHVDAPSSLRVRHMPARPASKP